MSFICRPMRGGEKLELPQPMLPGLHREQQRPPHLHPPPPHRTWEQLGQLYESHLPPQGHPIVPLPNEHSLRLHNGGYAGTAGPPPNPHLPHTRPNQLLKVRSNTYVKKLLLDKEYDLVYILSLLSVLVWGSSGAARSPGPIVAGR